MKKVIVFLIILIILLFIHLQFLNQQIQLEPVDLDIQENLKSPEDNITTESAEENNATDNNEVLEIEQELEIENEDDFVQNNEDNSVEVEIEQEKEVDNTAENPSKGSVNYTTQSGIDIVGEIDFDMSLEEEISEEDKIEALKYAAKVDVPYLLKLVKDGITDEDKLSIAEHLRERLTDEEYNKTKQLIIKYLFLLK